MSNTKTLVSQFKNLLKDYNLENVDLGSKEGRDIVIKKLNKMTKEEIDKLSDKVRTMEFNVNLNEWLDKVYTRFSDAFENVTKEVEKENNLNNSIISYIDKYIDTEIKPNYQGKWDDSIESNLKEVLKPFLTWLMKQI